MRRGFGLNTNILETNVLNLLVVFWVVVTFVGDAFRTTLDQRRETVLSTLQEADQKIREAQELLEKARKAVETARTRAQEIRAQADQLAEQESVAIQKQLKRDLQRLIERGRQTINLEKQSALQSIAKNVARLALNSAEKSLIADLKPKGPISSKQKELNEMHVSETFLQLKSFSLLIFFNLLQLERKSCFSHQTFIIYLRLWLKFAQMKLVVSFDNKLNNIVKKLVF